MPNFIFYFCVAYFSTSLYSVKNQNHASHFAHNHLAFDLGYNHENDELEHVEQISKEIIQTYDLILIRYY